MEENKLTLKEFIDRKEKILVIFGVILAVFSISFLQIQTINSNYASYLSIITCIILFLLIAQLFNEVENLSLETKLFAGGITGIAILIFLMITNIYKSQIQSLLNFAGGILFMVLGGYSYIKIHEQLDKIKYKFITNLILTIISIFLIFFFNFVIKFLIDLTNIIKLTYFLSTDLIKIYFIGFVFLFIFLGLSISGYSILLKKYIKEFISDKLKNK